MIFIAYKSDLNTYTVTKFSHPNLPDPFYDHYKDLPLQGGLSKHINGYVGAMCVTHNRVALIYRRLQPNKHFNHYLSLFDHSLNKPDGDDFHLPSFTRFITAIASFGNGAQYLFCDPRGQQLLFYHSTDRVLTRRFRIGATNACCLSDGKLVLWLQKQHPSSTAKLHFITPPHLEDPADVAKSLPLLYQK